MPVTIYYDQDADLATLKGKTVAVLGYGSQGHAHAQNLRDSGVNVIGSELPGTDNYQLACEHKFKPVTAAEATEKGDLMLMTLADVVQAVNFKEPKMPVVGNCSSRTLSTVDEIRAELVNGLCQCVQWKGSVQHLVDSGVTEFVEFGSGGVLAGLIRRIDRGVKVTTVSDTASMRKLIDGEA